MILQVHKTEQGYVAVSDEAIRHIKEELRYAVVCHRSEGKLHSPVLIENVGGTWDDFNKPVFRVIASTFPLEGIPLFDLEETDVMAPDYAPHFKEVWIEGYKAAQSKGCFTEDQLREAMKYASSYISTERVIESYIESLKQPRTLVGIEVEDEMVDPEEEYWGSLEYAPFRAKITNNKLTVTRHIYE